MTQTPHGTRPLDAAERVANADERSSLEGFLEYYRDAVKRKIAGISEEQARRSLVPSATTLGVIIKHLRGVEQGWFQELLGNVAVRTRERGSEFRLEPTETVATLLEEYDKQCAISREVAAGHALTDTVAAPVLGEVSLRWIYLHMIEETARHAGHADILREQIDGTVGD